MINKMSGLAVLFMESKTIFDVVYPDYCRHFGLIRDDVSPLHSMQCYRNAVIWAISRNSYSTGRPHTSSCHTRLPRRQE